MSSYLNYSCASTFLLCLCSHESLGQIIHSPTTFPWTLLSFVYVCDAHYPTQVPNHETQLQPPPSLCWAANTITTMIRILHLIVTLSYTPVQTLAIIFCMSPY